jgi:DNA-binding NarL/FixJ family response regulator
MNSLPYAASGAGRPGAAGGPGRTGERKRSADEADHPTPAPTDPATTRRSRTGAESSVRGEGRPRVAVVTPAALLKPALEALVEADPGLEVRHKSDARPPDAVLCAVESAAGLRHCRKVLPLELWLAAALYDLADQFGPAGAALNGFRGYAPGDVSAERLCQCLRRVAAGRLDAPVEQLETLIRVSSQPPLDADELKILQLLAWGRSHKEIVEETGLRKSTFEAQLNRLQLLFEATSGHHLGGMAQAWNLALPFEEEPPDWAQVALLRPKRQRKR